jgi:bacterioferritin (cytochrome b1)
VGDVLARYDRSPTLQAIVPETVERYSTDQILQKSFEHEQSALALYKDLKTIAADVDSELEAFAQSMIEQESSHGSELEEMLRNLSKL